MRESRFECPKIHVPHSCCKLLYMLGGNTPWHYSRRVRDQQQLCAKIRPEGHRSCDSNLQTEASLSGCSQIGTIPWWAQLHQVQNLGRPCCSKWGDDGISLVCVASSTQPRYSSSAFRSRAAPLEYLRSFVSCEGHATALLDESQSYRRRHDSHR